jgi:hypothetical protein
MCFAVIWKPTNPFPATVTTYALVVRPVDRWTVQKDLRQQVRRLHAVRMRNGPQCDLQYDAFLEQYWTITAAAATARRSSRLKVISVHL